jgi:hypothetical protein
MTSTIIISVFLVDVLLDTLILENVGDGLEDFITQGNIGAKPLSISVLITTGGFSMLTVTRAFRHFDLNIFRVLVLRHVVVVESASKVRRLKYLTGESKKSPMDRDSQE